MELVTTFIALLLVGLALGGLAATWLRVDKQRVVHTRQSAGPRKVLILTAAIGGGHAAAGAALREDLARAGHRVVLVDGIEAMSARFHWLLVQGYAQPLRFAPWLLELVFVFTSHRNGARLIHALVSCALGRRLAAVIESHDPDVVISTYPLVTGVLGRLRARGQLLATALAVIPDYGAHALWVHPGLDMHLVVSPESAALVRRVGGAAMVAELPAVRSQRDPISQAAARASLGLPLDAFIVLIIGGAWGIGDVEGAAQEAIAAGAYPLVVTGRNERLRGRLECLFRTEAHIHVLGWRTDMPVLMCAADCMIQNAGGMTCLEAIDLQLPIVLYKPIPGHGRLNATVMEQAGAARCTQSSAELRRLLGAAARHEIRLPLPFRKQSDPRISDVLATLSSTDPVATPEVPRRRLPWRGLAALGLAGSLLVGAFTPSQSTALSTIDTRIDRVRSRIGRNVDDRVKHYWLLIAHTIEPQPAPAQ